MKRNILLVWLTALLAVLFSGALSFAFFSSQETYVDGDIPYTKEECRQAAELIDLVYEQYDGKAGTLLLEKEQLSEYIQVLSRVQEDRLVVISGHLYSEEETQEALSHFSYSLPQARARFKLLEFCEKKLRITSDYQYYVRSVQANVTNFQDVRLFSNGVKNLYVKANKDFYGLEEMKLHACVDAGLTKYLDGKTALVVGFLFAVCSAILFMRQFGESAGGEALTTKQGSSLWWFLPAVLIGMIGIFLAEVYAAQVTWGLEELFRPVQSVSQFRSCPEVITVAALLAIRICFRCFAVMTVFFLTLFVLSMQKKWLAVLVGGVLLGAELLLDYHKMPFTLYAQGFAENIFGSYTHVFLFDKPIPAWWIFTFVSIFLLIASTILASHQIRNLRLAARAKAEQLYFEKVDEKYTQARLLRHDMNNHLSAVAMLLKEGKTEDAQKYLESVMEELESTKPPVRTGIGVLDAVLMSKDAKAKEKGIALTMEFDPVLLRSGIPDYELCSLFGNLLDNCLEACENLPEKDRWAKLRVTRQMDMLCIFSENPYGELQKENGKIVTRKADAASHGFGLRQMERIAAKHGGTMEIETKDQIFAVSILFSIEQAAK